MFVDIRIVRPDGTDCEPHETGELLVSGPNVTTGYWNRADATRDAIDEDGWLRTGDAARVDDEGFVWIVDRMKDAFAVPGQIVYPGDVERVLGEHPAVLEAGVAPHDGLVVGFVVLAVGQLVSDEELIEFCTSRLAPYEVPSSIIFVDELPRSSVGKLLRHELVATTTTNEGEQDARTRAT
jgi:acyl-CoA synthetase (AMP-forming)/AMP-acid ligase II